MESLGPRPIVSISTPTAKVVVTLGTGLPITYFPGASTILVGTGLLSVDPSIPTSTYVDGDELKIQGDTLYLNNTPMPTTPIQGSPMTGIGDGSLPTILGNTGILTSSASSVSAISTSSASAAQPTATESQAAISPSATTGSSSSLSSGTVAGLAVACFFAGLLIALTIGFLCLRRKNGKSKSTDFAAAPGYLGERRYTEPKQRNASEQSTLAIPISPKVQSPSAEDYQLEREMAHMHQRIHMHVGMYYDNAKILQIPDEFFDFTSLGPTMSIPSATLATLLSGLSSRQAAIHFCIAWTVITRLGADCPIEWSLLPAEMVICLQQLRSNSVDGNEATLALHSRWRILTAGLVQAKHGHALGVSPSSVQNAVNAVEEVLQPFVNDSQAEAARCRNLQEVVEHGARLGFLLMAQPGVFEFNWENPVREPGSLVVFPALLQVADEDGTGLHPLKALALAEVARGLRV